jgi:hypothetical protein
MDNKGCSYDARQKQQMFSFHFRHFLVFSVATMLLTSCGLHFRKDSFETGLLEIGQLAAHHNCKQQRNQRASQSCITQVDNNYDEIIKRDK